jgi:hypothetical protein
MKAPLLSNVGPSVTHSEVYLVSVPIPARCSCELPGLARQFPYPRTQVAYLGINVSRGEPRDVPERINTQAQLCAALGKDQAIQCPVWKVGEGCTTERSQLKLLQLPSWQVQ